QPKAGNISGCITLCAEINPAAAYKRLEQGWVDACEADLDALIARVRQAQANKEVVALAYVGNIVDLWERLAEEGLFVHVGTDQTSLHNPWSGGYYPADYSFEQAQQLMQQDPEAFKTAVQASLRRHVAAIARHTERGTYFFDYGNAFLLEASRAGADLKGEGEQEFRYPSYVQ
ncbi:hypothetical protein RZS08_16400, partial [Arthrospira platensis SPKY1]|nr:hypothetical protein [Arthrospira platensis SPKY1]